MVQGNAVSSSKKEIEEHLPLTKHQGSFMSKRTDAYNRGLAAGKAAGANLKKWMESLTSWARQSYPASRHLDYWKEVVQLDEERMNKPPSVSRFPETKELPDLLVAERKGFLDGSGGGPEELAFHYTWSFFVSRRLNTRYIGTGIRANHCSEVYIRERKRAPVWSEPDDDADQAWKTFNLPRRSRWPMT